MASKRNRIPKFPEYQAAEKEPAKVQAALDEMEREEAEEEEEEEYEQDEEFVPNPTSVFP